MVKDDFTIIVLAVIFISIVLGIIAFIRFKFKKYNLLKK